MYILHIKTVKNVSEYNMYVHIYLLILKLTTYIYRFVTRNDSAKLL